MKDANGTAQEEGNLNDGLSILKSWLVGVAVTLTMVALFFTPLVLLSAFTIGLPFELVLGMISDITDPSADRLARAPSPYGDHPLLLVSFLVYFME